MEEKEQVLSLEGVSRAYHGLEALKDIQIKIEKGDFYILSGEEGSGRTTLSRIIMGLLRPSRGSLSAFGLPLAKNSRIIKKRIGYVPEEILYLENVTAGYFIRSNPCFRKETDEDELDRLCTLFGLDLNKKLLYMTYAENKMAAVINALVTGPELLILDEPDYVLEGEMRRTLYAELRRRADGGATVLLTCGDADDAKPYGDRLAFLEEGAVAAEVDLRREIPKEKVITVTGGSRAIFRVIGANPVFCEGETEVFAFSGSLGALKRALLLSDCSDFIIEDTLFQEQILKDYGRWQLNNVDTQAGIQEEA